jgi:hypothetical protein
MGWEGGQAKGLLMGYRGKKKKKKYCPKSYPSPRMRQTVKEQSSA